MSGTASLEVQWESLLAAAKAVACQPAKKSDWNDSPFVWLKALELKERGDAVARVLEYFLEVTGCVVDTSTSTDADRVINNVPVEIKGCMISSQGYTFGQIRNQEWRVLLLLTLHPHNAELWAIPKTVFYGQFVAVPALSGFYKHHGSDETPNTWQLKFTLPPEWLKAYGGTLSQGLSKLRELLAPA